jgi:putative RecB family exonuclease
VSASAAPEISFSRLRTFVRCPWLFHLVYDLGWRSGPNSSQALGHSLHRTLAQWASPDNKDFSLEHLMEIYDQVWVNEGFGSPQETFEAYENGRSMLEKFFQLEQSRPSVVVAAEMDFIETFDGVTVRGSIDRVDKRPDGSLEVIEYKTNAAAWPPARRDNDLQMTMYQLALMKRQSPQAPVHLSYILLSTGERHETTRTQAQREEAFDLVRRTAVQAAQKNYEPNFASCPGCEFNTRCEKVKKKT